MSCLVTKLNVKINSTKLDSFLTPILEYDTERDLWFMYSASGASIYYTLDGTEPTTSSNLYTDPIRIGTKTIKMIAVKGSKTTNIPSLAVNYNADDSIMSASSEYPMQMSTNNGSFVDIENEQSIDIIAGNKYTIKTNNEVSTVAIKN